MQLRATTSLPVPDSPRHQHADFFVCYLFQSTGVLLHFAAGADQ